MIDQNNLNYNLMNDNGLGGLNKLILSDSPLKEQTD